MFHLHPTDLLFKFLLFSNHSVPSLCHVMKRSPLKGPGEARFCSMQIVQSAVHQAVVSLFYSSTKFGWATNFTSCWYAGDLVESEPWKSMKIHETCLIHRILSQPINSMSFIKTWPLSQMGTGRYFSLAGHCRKHFSPWCAFINLSWSTMTEHWHSHSAVTSAIKAGLWYARCTTCKGRSLIKPRWSFHQSQVNLNDCYNKNQTPRPSSLIIVILGTCQGYGYFTMSRLFSVRSGAHTQT